jgi:hypothetical protein
MCDTLSLTTLANAAVDSDIVAVLAPEEALEGSGPIVGDDLNRLTGPKFLVADFIPAHVALVLDNGVDPRGEVDGEGKVAF